MKLPIQLLFLTILVFHVSATLHSSPPPVVIVGAGAAGIAAATKLVEYGFTNTIVLEAENRIGGRINSVFFGAAYVELGAEWCHGRENNIVHELVKDFEILRPTADAGEIYHSSKKIDKEFVEELRQVMNEIYDGEPKGSVAEGVSLGQHIRNKYNSAVYLKFGNDSEKLAIAKSAIDYFHKVVLTYEGSFSWDEPSAKTDYKQCADTLIDMHWNGMGYKTVLEVLMNKFPDPSKQTHLNILLKKEVVKIIWNASESVSVVCSDNTAYLANHVIFTPSIGVLKAQHEQIFSPHLPESKQQAIKDIGIGAVMKVILHFKDPWWLNSNFTDFYFFWSEEDRNNAYTEFPRGAVKDGRSWLTTFFCLIPAKNNPKVMIAWFTGDLVPEIEIMDDATILEGIDFVLKKFLGHQHIITKPNKMIRSSWYSNPHFRGSYSYQTIEARKNHKSAEAEIEKPLTIDGRPVVLFAGEASHPHYFSTVHGAIETGHREANRIINI